MPRIIGDGYATVSAGTRAASDPTSGGLAFETTERFGVRSAGQEFARRTGLTVSGRDRAPGDRSVGIGQCRRTVRSERSGRLGDALAAAGYERAVIATQTGRCPTIRPTTAITATRRPRSSDSRGVVPAGAVGTDLLQTDPNAPFGVRLDPDKVIAAFEVGVARQVGRTCRGVRSRPCRCLRPLCDTQRTRTPAPRRARRDGRARRTSPREGRSEPATRS